MGQNIPAPPGQPAPQPPGNAAGYQQPSAGYPGVPYPGQEPPNNFNNVAAPPPAFNYNIPPRQEDKGICGRASECVWDWFEHFRYNFLSWKGFKWQRTMLLNLYSVDNNLHRPDSPNDNVESKDDLNIRQEEYKMTKLPPYLSCTIYFNYPHSLCEKKP